MGEIADLMIDGSLCSECGALIEDGGDGVPRICLDCADARKGAKATRRERAASTFQHCARLALSHGMRLIRHTETHFALYGPQSNPWLINVYPGNRRLYSDPKRVRAPRLASRMPLDWSLEDVVNAAVKAEKGK